MYKCIAVPERISLFSKMIIFRFRAWLFLSGLLLSSTLQAATLPPGFSETLVANGIVGATAMEFSPDGRLFVCEQRGRIRVIKNGQLLPTPFIELKVDSFFERGLLGIAFDPSFLTNGYIYLYYTALTPAVHNRVSRFTARGDVVVPGSERIILELDNLSSAGNHNGGAIHFGRDGKLYIGVGENANPANSQTLGNLLGKILRINPDGTIPEDNPFYNTASGKNRAIWTLGLRNPFTFAVEPITGKIHINDVGQHTAEEINLGLSGANYGWPETEGYTLDERYRSPLYAYGQRGGEFGGCAITGGAFYNPPTMQFPLSYIDSYFFADMCGGWIRRLDNQNVSHPFASGIQTPVDLKVSFDGSLYYLARDDGAVYRINYDGAGSLSPVISSQPSSKLAQPGDSVTFTVNASGAQPISFQWLRNGTPLAGANGSSLTLNNLKLSDDGAEFTVRVSNGHGAVVSSPAKLRVVDLQNNAPIGTIITPAPDLFVNAGTTINYEATATDKQDGDLPDTAFTWEVVAHHKTHTHPFIPPKSGMKKGSFNIPTRVETSGDVWFRLHLTVTDSEGLTHKSFRDIKLRKSNFVLTSNPSGLKLRIDGQTVVTPVTIESVVGMPRTIEAISPQSLDGIQWTFQSWSDGGAGRHDIVTRSTSATYTALFRRGTGAARQALLVTGPGELGSGDVGVKEVLENLGYSVVVKSGSDLQTSDSTGKALVVISSSVTSADVADRFTNVAIPVVTFEAWLFDDLGMTDTEAGDDYGYEEGVTELSIISSGHQLSAGLSGTVKVTNDTGGISWGSPSDDAIRIATLPGEPSRAAIFGYPKGSLMPGLQAPARRVGLFLLHDTAADLTPEGTALLREAINWATFDPPAPLPQRGEALFVVGSLPLTTGDVAVKTFVENLGFAVKIETSLDTASQSSTGKALVLISSTVPSYEVNTKFRDVTVPVLTWEGWLYDDLGMTSDSGLEDYGYSEQETSLLISGTTHQISAGLTGQVKVTNDIEGLTWGVPNQNASRIATVVDNPQRSYIFAYEKGSQMPGLIAPSRRVGMYLLHQTATSLTPEGRLLLRQSINWVVAQ
jgi:glucose/arabinose dehydrogenase